MKGNPLEKDIEKKVCAHAVTLGFLHYKFTSPSRRSVPDRWFIPDNLPPFLVEFKRRGERPTPGQEAEITKLRKQGLKVFIIDSVELGKALVKEYHVNHSKVVSAPRFDPGFICDSFNLENF